MTPRWPEVEYRVSREASILDYMETLVPHKDGEAQWANLFQCNAAAVRIATRIGPENKVVAAIQVFERGSARHPDEYLIKQAEVGLRDELIKFLRQERLIK